MSVTATGDLVYWRQYWGRPVTACKVAAAALCERRVHCCLRPNLLAHLHCARCGHF